MMSAKVRFAITEMNQVDILIEMVIGHLVKNPDDIHSKEWFIKLENALHLLESVHKSKKANLVSALEGGADDE